MADEKSWETYEQVAQYLLNECCDSFGLGRVEGKQSVPGRLSGTDWEIDAKGVKDDGGAFVIVECRRYTTQGLSQEQMGGLAWRISDTGASSAILVTPLPVQQGAEKVAAAANVTQVLLNADATTTEYFMRFLDQIRLGLMDTVTLSLKESLVLRHYDASGEFIREEVVVDELGADPPE